jgi:hypothetical protein
MNFEDLTKEVRKDGLEQAAIGDVRKPRLMLKHLNKLRKIRELRNLEQVNQSRQLELIYGEQPETEGF